MNKRKLKVARIKIDKLDNDIFYLIKKRTKIIQYMLGLKQFKNEIIDQKRIKEILNKIKIKSIKNKIDPKITTKIWKAMIWGYVEYQKKNFRKK